MVLDTNFLMIPGQFKVDIFEEIKRLMIDPYEVGIYKETIDELNKIAAANTRDKMSAKIALKLIKQKNLKTLKNSSSETSYIDEIILNNVAEEDVVCTQDKALKRLLKTRYPGIRIITLNRKLIMR